jgi:hypothetical protein
MEWLKDHDVLMYWLSGASVVMLVASMLLVPVLIVKLPADYFQKQPKSKTKRSSRHPGIRLVLFVGRNILGWVLILAGLAMLVLPGQGVLVLLIGLVMVDLPGKHRLVLWIISRPRILKTANWLRTKFHKPPLALEG